MLHATLVYEGAEALSLSTVCWQPDVAPEFTYDEITGKCTNSLGVEGMNPWHIILVRESGQGECVDFDGVELNEQNYAYPVLDSWNLRGADLSGAILYFADLVDADLAGANLDGFQFGYATVTGTADPFTVGGACAPVDGVVSCTQ